ncbi:hypothetical protein C8R43DRAFT_1118352 [Mycena crocata]|nr:hypothetical protein C8R43DRAFT_1118352 [Mycena crocata]
MDKTEGGARHKKACTEKRVRTKRQSPRQDQIGIGAGDVTSVLVLRVYLRSSAPRPTRYGTLSVIRRRADKAAEIHSTAIRATACARNRALHIRIVTPAQSPTGVPILCLHASHNEARSTRNSRTHAPMRIHPICTGEARTHGSTSSATKKQEVDARTPFARFGHQNTRLSNAFVRTHKKSERSSALYATYYHVQILLHRPLLQTMINPGPSPSVFKSLAICANAARSVALIADVRTRRRSFPHSQFMACLIKCSNR